jgi:hypothetical protein
VPPNSFYGAEGCYRLLDETSRVWEIGCRVWEIGCREDSCVLGVFRACEGFWVLGTFCIRENSRGPEIRCAHENSLGSSRGCCRVRRRGRTCESCGDLSAGDTMTPMGIWAIGSCVSDHGCDRETCPVSGCGLASLGTVLGPTDQTCQ